MIEGYKINFDKTLREGKTVFDKITLFETKEEARENFVELMESIGKFKKK